MLTEHTPPLFPYTPPQSSKMTRTPLENLSSYTTPTQSQQQQPTDPGNEKEREDTPGQKRKRPSAEPPNEREPQQGNEPPQAPATICTPPRNIPPNDTPPTTRDLPSYEMPQFNRPSTQSPQASPTHEAQKRRKLATEDQATRETTQGQDMEVDEDIAQEAGQNDTPTAAPQKRQSGDPPGKRDNPAPQEEGTTGGKGTDIMVEVDELANAKTLARVLTVADKPTVGKGPKNPSEALDKYTKGQTPPIYDEDPATLLARIDPVQIGSWLDLPTGKVLARPFDLDVRYKPNHQQIAQSLAAAVREITGTTSVAIAPPNKDPTLPRRESQPFTFLIHNITKEDERTLLEREVWSSQEITFQVATIYIKRPEFLFTVKGFSTPEPADVMASLAETWEDPVTSTLIKTLASFAPSQEDQQEWYSQMIDFLESATVRHLDIRNQGGRENPHFNVYANGDLIEDDETWLQLRKYLRNRTYKTMVIGTGKALQDDFVCSLCHGHDHPRGLCPFPQIPGWNGGGRLPKRPEHMNANAQGQAPPHHPHNKIVHGRGRNNYHSQGLPHTRGQLRA